ncbi:MAG: TetR/AcrR family transcriptional regulator [Sandaracinaceae bacterium]
MARLSGEERKGSILESAIAVFARGGFNGSTTSALARAAGITEALLYRHFRSKRALFKGAVRHVLETVDTDVEDILARHDHPVRALRSLFAYFVSQLRKNPELSHLIYVVATELREDEDLKELYVRYQDRIHGRLELAIRRWEADGYLRPGTDPRAAAWLILGAHQTLTLMEQTGRLDEFGPQHVRSFVQAFLTDDAREALTEDE